MVSAAQSVVCSAPAPAPLPLCPFSLARALALPLPLPLPLALPAHTISLHTLFHWKTERLGPCSALVNDLATPVCCHLDRYFNGPNDPVRPGCLGVPVQLLVGASTLSATPPCLLLCTQSVFCKQKGGGGAGAAGGGPHFPGFPRVRAPYAAARFFLSFCGFPPRCVPGHRADIDEKPIWIHEGNDLAGFSPVGQQAIEVGTVARMLLRGGRSVYGGPCIKYTAPCYVLTLAGRAPPPQSM